MHKMSFLSSIPQEVLWRAREPDVFAENSQSRLCAICVGFYERKVPRRLLSSPIDLTFAGFCVKINSFSDYVTEKVDFTWYNKITKAATSGLLTVKPLPKGAIMQYFISFIEGIITFISPCLLPMLPLYVSYFAGGESKSTGKALRNALGFVLGFTTIFVLMGALAGTDRKSVV